LEVVDLGEKQATVKQILVITDGCSNIGNDPIEAAMRARRAGIVVNVIGVVDKGDMGKTGREEAMSIADAGGGMCRIVHPADLAATAQMMTHHTMQATLQQVVNQQLQQLMGKQSDDLPPAERTRIMQVVDKLEEEVSLRLAVAIDTSASMKEKMLTVREAVRDLSFSLQARLGKSTVAVISFPGQGEDLVNSVSGFADKVDMQSLDRLFVARGGTPTGPAIDFAVSLFDEQDMDDAENWANTPVVR
jgi:Ca-activated chloride channel homolog